MMIYILFIVLMSLFVLSYFFAGRDFFAPATVQVLTFAGAVFMCIYFMLATANPHDFQVETVGLVSVVMAMNVSIGIIAHWIVSKIEIKADSPENDGISPISDIASCLIVVVIVATMIWMLVEIRRIGGSSGDFFTTMHRFRSLNSYSTDEAAKFPWLLEQLRRLMEVFVILYAFNLAHFFNKLSLRQKAGNLVIIALSCVVLLLSGMRTPAVHALLGSFCVVHLLRIKKQGGYKPYALKSICCGALIIVLMMSAFFVTKAFVGRAGKTHDSSPSVYIAYYVGSGFIALDNYLRQPGQPNEVWGQYTFVTMIRFLKNHLGVDIPPFTGHLEFRPVGAGFANNVYTFIRVYHKDFGIVGVFTLSALSMIFLSVLYEYIKKKRGCGGILAISLMYYSVVMSFFTERFYSSVVSINFLKMLVCLLLLYSFLIRKRIRLGSHLFTFDHMLSSKTDRHIIISIISKKLYPKGVPQ